MNKRLVFGSIFLLAVLISISLFATIPGKASLEGEMDSEIWLSPDDPSGLFSPNSVVTWRGDYVTGNVEDLPSGISKVLYWPGTRLADTGLALSGRLKSGLVRKELFGLRLDGYFAREFGPDYPIGTLGGSARLSFSQEDLEYWANKGIVNYAGFSYQGVFLLEENPGASSGYGSGLEVSVSGTKLQGVTVEAKALFGMKPDPRELTGNADGSGYDTFTRDGKKIRGYSESEISFEDMKVGPVQLSSKSSFSADNGFEKTEIDFSVKEESGFLEFDGLITYAPKEKKVSLNPELDLEWACFDLYSEIVPGSLTGDKNELSGIDLKGYGINEIQLGNVQVSLVGALGDNFLYRERGKEDWRLRAFDYVFPAADRKLYYRETDYSGVLSLEGGMGNLYLGADAYWSPGGELFDLEGFTGEAEYQVSEFFELTAGLVLEAESGLRDIILNTIYRW